MAGLIPFNRRNSDLFGTGFRLENMLDDFFAAGWPFRRSLAADTFKIDVQDNGSAYVVEAELPGVAKNEVSVSLQDGRLNISVSKDESLEETSKNYIHKERRYSSMSRNILLADADEKGVKAKMDNGVLTITVPKKSKPQNGVIIDIE
jgi:HSP20 family protein